MWRFSIRCMPQQHPSCMCRKGVQIRWMCPRTNMIVAQGVHHSRCRSLLHFTYSLLLSASLLATKLGHVIATWMCATFHSRQRMMIVWGIPSWDPRLVGVCCHFFLQQLWAEKYSYSTRHSNITQHVAVNYVSHIMYFCWPVSFILLFQFWI